jgi:hypothetical protein
MRRAAALAVSAGLAVAACLALAAPAAGIVADGTDCTLAEAILTANAGGGNLGNGCGAGSAGADTIELGADVVLTAPDPSSISTRGGLAGLPDVSSTITIVAAAGDTIERDLATLGPPVGCLVGNTPFRFFNVTGSGSLTLQGITLSNGCVAAASGQDAHGGAVLVEGAVFSAIDSTFTGNRVRGGAQGSLGAGGAVAAMPGSTVTVQRSSFVDNLARGGISNTLAGQGFGGAVQTSNSSVVIDESDFDANEAIGGECTTACSAGYATGGALHAGGGDLAVTDSVFDSNTATGGVSNGGSGGSGQGGAIYTDSATGFLQRLIVSANIAEGGQSAATTGAGGLGGGIFVTGGAAPEILDSRFIQNLALGLGSFGAFGGGAYFAVVGPVVRGSSFLTNSAQGAPKDPPVAAFGGAMAFAGNVDATVANSTLAGNWAEGGDSTGVGGNGANALGGAIFSSAALHLSHVTIAANEAIGGSGAGGSGAALGGGIYVSTHDSPLDNVLLVDNTSTVSGQLPVDEDCWDGSVAIDPAVDSAGYNLVEGLGNCTFGGPGDLTGPAAATGLGDFADHGCPTALRDGTCPGTFSLDPGSPALDGGSCAVSGADVDQRGVLRPQGHGDVADADDGCDVGALELEATGFHTVTPCRVLDTRNAGQAPALSHGTVRSFAVAGACGVAADATAVAVNVTVTAPSGGGHVTLYPGGDPTPATSTLNFAAAQTRANNAVVPLGAGGDLDALAILGGGGTAHLIVDVVGYFR